jgi:hypothetical protein
MTKTSALRALPLAALLLAACGVRKNTTDVSPGVRFAATCPNVVQVYQTRSDVPSDYYEIAFIEAEGNSVYTTDNQLQEQIKIGAAKVGATAVIANPVEQSKTAVKVLGEAVGAKSATQKASALAIYSPSDRDRVRQVCGS